MAETTQHGTNIEAQEAGESRLTAYVFYAGIALLVAAGIAGWLAMGPTLFHLMATGIGWLCM